MTTACWHLSMDCNRCFSSNNLMFELFLGFYYSILFHMKWTNHSRPFKLGENPGLIALDQGIEGGSRAISPSWCAWSYASCQVSVWSSSISMERQHNLGGCEALNPWPLTFGCFHGHGGTQKCLVYKGTSHEHEWFRGTIDVWSCGGFHRNRGYFPASSILVWDIPWNKPSIWG